MNTTLIQRALDLLPHLTDADIVVMSEGRKISLNDMPAVRKELEDGLRAALRGEKNPVADLFFRRVKKFGIS